MKTSKLLKILSGLTILTVIGKMLAFFRESIISARYGAGFITDIYFFEDGLVNILNSVFASVISSTFIPIYLDMKNDKEKKRYINVVLTVLGLICCILIIICMFFTDELLHVVVPGFYGKYNMNYVIMITRIFLPTVLMVFLENIFVVIFQANEFYFYSTVQSLILNIGLILYLLFGYQYGIMGIILIKIISHLLILAILIMSLRKKVLLNYKFIPDFRDEKMKKMVKLSLPLLFVCFLSQFNYMIDRTMSSLLPSGSISLISYATTVSMLAYYVIESSFTHVFYTAVSKVQNNKEEMSKELLKFTKYLLRILIPVCIVIGFFSYNIVGIVYGRGEMTTANLKIVSLLVIIYLPGTFLLCIKDLLNRVCYASKYTYITSISASTGFILNVILNIIFAKIMGIYGLAFATSLSAFISTAILIILIKQKRLITKVHHEKKTSMILRILVIVILNYLFFLYLGRNLNILINIITVGMCFIVSIVLLNIDLVVSYISKKI